jgi:hypothetical protein
MDRRAVPAVSVGTAQPDHSLYDPDESRKSETMSNQRGAAITRRIRPPRLALSVLVAGVLALGATALTGVGVASAATLDGVATIASPSNDAPLSSGGSTTLFTVTLPANAACSGDTASGGYHIYSYLVQQGSSVPAVVQPLTFTTQPSAGYGLLDSSGTYFGPANTAITTGQVIGIPTDFEWEPLANGVGLTGPSGLLYSGGSSGVWEAGIACANTSGVLTDYWNTEITFTSSVSDPNHFVWSAGPPAVTPEVPYTLVLPVLAIGIIGASVLLRRRHVAGRVNDSTSVV